MFDYLIFFPISHQHQAFPYEYIIFGHIRMFLIIRQIPKHLCWIYLQTLTSVLQNVHLWMLFFCLFVCFNHSEVNLLVRFGSLSCYIQDKLMLGWSPSG